MITLAEQSKRVANGDIDPLALVESHLAVIDQREAAIRAWVVVDREGALAQARQLAEDVRRGDAKGEMLGAIVGVKDIMHVAGLPTRSGAKWTSDVAASADSPIVAHLRRAGAIILGKTVTTELACFDPPMTRNPLDLERTPGGSSSGSAAAVAAGMCQLALGSQTGGSITRPAAFCGVLGMKPTFGLLSLAGITPVSDHLDHPGPMGRCVEDLFQAFSVMRNRPGAESKLDSTKCEMEPPRLARIDGFFRDVASADVWSVYDRAVQTLGPLPEFRLPESFSSLLTMHRRLMVADAAHAHQTSWNEHREVFSPGIAALIEEGLAVRLSDYIEASKHQIAFRRDLIAALASSPDSPEALLTPATVTTAPGLETTGDPRFNAPWSYCGWPTISFPCGIANDDLPVSVQLVGRPHSERRLAEIASWCQLQMQKQAGSV